MSKRRLTLELPPPPDARTHRLQPRFTAEELARLQRLADERGEPVAVLVRVLAMRALEALGR